MDTNSAIQILQTESDNLGVSIGTQTNLKAALDLAIQQLQGILATDIAAEVAPLQAELDATKAELDTANASIAAAAPMEMGVKTIQ